MAEAIVKAAARPRLRAADRKREILDAAAEVFAAKGYERASMAEIAAKVGVVESAVYRHFATKRDLLFATMRAFYAPTIERNRRQLTGIHGTRNRLRFLIGEHLRAFAEQPGICRLIIQEVRPYQDYRDSVVHELNRETTALALGVIEEAMARGEFRSDLPATLVRDVIYGGIEHVMWRALSGDVSADVVRLADELTDLVIRGVAVQSEPADAGDDHVEGRLARLEAEFHAVRAQLGRPDKATEATGPESCRRQKRGKQG